MTQSRESNTLKQARVRFHNSEPSQYFLNVFSATTTHSLTDAARAGETCSTSCHLLFDRSARLPFKAKTRLEPDSGMSWPSNVALSYSRAHVI
eukprot:986350-Amphidinium_carterae.1